MKLIIINSNSMGNAYVLQASTGEMLLIECGVQFEKIKRVIDFKLSNVAGCVLTHEHGDHAKSIIDVLKAGINVYASAGTFHSLAISDHHRAISVKNQQVFRVGAFKVMAFDVKHDVAEPLGFLINHPESGNILFLTDSYYCEYTFKNLHQVIIEANYCQKILDDRLLAGTNPKFLRDRVLESHMSLETCKKTLRANDLSAVQNIVLIHLSDGNSNAKQFLSEVQQETGKMVHVADAGVIIENFNKTPF